MTDRNPTAPGTKLPMIPSNATYRVYAIRKARMGGVEVEVIGEQIGGNYATHAAAAAAGKASGLRYQVEHVGGRE